ncbi:MAG: C40 family peptidase [Nocardiopsaceae bacterium]|jgi:cell wall-associated NlpC family hydrolase|nr:C40 family peptidase [Nocardiopsaceae bacterium]
MGAEGASPADGESPVTTGPLSDDISTGEGSLPVSGEPTGDACPAGLDGAGASANADDVTIADDSSPVTGHSGAASSDSPIDGNGTPPTDGAPENSRAALEPSDSPPDGDATRSLGLGASNGSNGDADQPAASLTSSSPPEGHSGQAVDGQPLAAASPAGKTAAAGQSTSDSSLSGDARAADNKVAPSAAPSFLARNRRVLVALAAVVVVAAGLAVATQVLPSGESSAQSGNVAATSSAVVPHAPSSGAPSAPSSASAVPTGVPEAGEFGAWASRTSQWLDIPLRAMNGYAKATVTLSKEQPNCHLSWITLAAIGKVTSDHGRTQGGRIGDNGTLAKPLGTVEVRDFYHRVVSSQGAAGPLQLSPAVWSKWQRSASGGKPDIQNVDDSALTAGRALCANGRDLATDWWNGVATLEPAPVVLHRTLATTNVYGTVGQNSQPPNPAVLTAVDFAIDQIGLPYVWGGNGTRDPDPGFDCSGLTTAAYASADVKLMRTADTQFRSIPHVSEPQLGDLIFYGAPATKIHHVGLYIGNQQMIDAPQTGQAVQVHPYRKPGDDYAGAGRPTQ